MRNVLENYSERAVRKRQPKLEELLKMHTDENHHFVISEDTNHVISFRLISLP